MKNLNLKMLALSLLTTVSVFAQHNPPPIRRQFPQPTPPPIVVTPSPIAVTNPVLVDNTNWSQRETLVQSQVNQVLNGQGQVLPVRATLGLQPGSLVRKVIVIAMSRAGQGRLEVLADGQPALITSNGMQSYEKIVGTSLETIEAEVNLVVGQNLQTLQLRTDGNLMIALVGATLVEQIQQPPLPRPGPQPVPRPIPQPIPQPVPQPRPVPTPMPMPIPPRGIACSQDLPNAYQATFQRIKSFAYSSGGLNMTDQGATNFALDWTNRRSCGEADSYLRRVATLREFAYSTAGLDMTSDGARNFALENESRVCVDDTSFISEFKQHYQFAYSPSGLNMTSQGARNYAWGKIQPKFFVCQR